MSELSQSIPKNGNRTICIQLPLGTYVLTQCWHWLHRCRTFCLLTSKRDRPERTTQSSYGIQVDSYPKEANEANWLKVFIQIYKQVYTNIQGRLMAKELTNESK